jgi:hypothetical protein
MSKKSKFIVAAAIAVLGLSSQASAKGQPSQAFCRVQRQVWCLHSELAKGGDFHLNSYYQQAMAVTTQAFAAGGSGRSRRRGVPLAGVRRCPTTGLQQSRADLQSIGARSSGLLAMCVCE